MPYIDTDAVLGDVVIDESGIVGTVCSISMDKTGTEYAIVCKTDTHGINHVVRTRKIFTSEYRFREEVGRKADEHRRNMMKAADERIDEWNSLKNPKPTEEEQEESKS